MHSINLLTINSGFQTSKLINVKHVYSGNKSVHMPSLGWVSDLERLKNTMTPGYITADVKGVF